MAFPADVKLVRVTCGTGYDFSGDPIAITLEVTPVLGGSLKRLIHAATGTFMTRDALTFKSDPGSPATFTVPSPAQAETWKDGSGAFFTNWSYSVTVTTRTASGKIQSWIQSFQPVDGQETVDLDLVPDGQIGSPTSAPAPAVTSVNGQSGAVVIDAGESVTPESVAANLTVEAVDAKLPERLSESALSAATDKAVDLARPGTRIIALGDSLSSPDGGAPTGQSWVEHVKTRSEGRVYLVRNSAIPGNTTAQMLSRVDSDVIAHSPQIVTFLGGTNDLTSNVPLPTMQQNVRDIWAKLKAVNVDMVILSIPPRSMADKKLPETSTWNSWLRQFAQQERLSFIDIHKHLVDPATGGYLAEYGNADGLHFSRLGAAKVGDVVFDELVPQLPLGGIEVPTYNLDPNNLLSNPLLLNGTDAAPESWSYNALAGGVTRTRVDDPDFPGGKAWEVSIAAPATAVTVNFQQNITTGWTPGDRMRFMAKFKVISADTLPEVAGDPAMRNGFGVSALFYGAPSGTVQPLVRFQSLAGHGGIAWGDTNVPEGTTGPVQVVLVVTLPAGYSGVWRMGAASAQNLTALGLA